MTSSIYPIFEQARIEGRKLLIPLADPDKIHGEKARHLGLLAQKADLPLILVGGSLLTHGTAEETIREIKTRFKGKVILFPGHAIQVSAQADGILLLSLISGRNPEFLIGQHVVAAPSLAQSEMEIIPTGYLLIRGGNDSSAAYMTQTAPIPADKPDIAACTALAGQMLGLRCIYLEAGSGALFPVSEHMIQKVKSAIQIPLIAGGGIQTGNDVIKAWKAGADAVVVGNILEKDPDLLLTLAASRSNSIDGLG
jgi:putative glycerol-1-phosphate prenyltransferase